MRSLKSPSRLSWSLAGLFAVTAVTGCEDPAASVPAASVSSAKPVGTAPAASASPTTTAAASAEPTGAASAAAIPAAPTRPADAIELSPASSKIEFTGSKVTGKHGGKFEKFTGWISLPDDKPENAKVFVEIDADSVKTDEEKLDTHLKADDFFATAKFPKATFVTTAIKPGGEKGATHTVTGNLYLHGVEKEVSFPAKITVAADKVTATSEFSINRKDWGILYEGQKDNLIRDDVVIKLSLSAARPKQ